MKDMDDFWKQINEIQKKVRKIQKDVLPKNSKLMDISTQQIKNYDKIKKQIPDNVIEFQKSLNDLQIMNNFKIPDNDKVKKMRSFLKHIQGINNAELNSEINQMTRIFGYPGSNLSNYQKENIYNLKSNFPFNKFNDDISKYPETSEKGNNDLHQSNNSIPVSNDKCPVDENISQNFDYHTVKSSLSKKEKAYFNESYNNDNNLPWNIFFSLISTYISNIDNPMPLMIVSFVISVINILVTNAKK